MSVGVRQMIARRSILVGASLPVTVGHFVRLARAENHMKSKSFEDPSNLVSRYFVRQVIDQRASY